MRNQPTLPTRRQFGVTTGAGLLLGGALFGAKEQPGIAVQLYSVRDMCGKDLPGTLAGIKKAGYAAVEFAGYYKHTAPELKKMLDDNGLKCCGTHTAMATVLGNELQATIDFNKILDNPYLIVPWLPDQYRASKQAWLDTAKLFNEISAKVVPQGMRIGYHNHAVEFTPVDGVMPWDLFFGNTVKDVIMQVDTGNCMEGGGDPIPYIAKYPGRAVSCHVKAHSTTKKGALIGEDDVDWKKFFTDCETVGGTKWFIVEEESGLHPGLEAITQSYINLKKILG
jgi:sugar phosphate isomerase/epimerase